MDRDTELVKKAQLGDSDAFEELVLTYEKKVYGMALRMTGSADDAFDVAQEVFIRAYRSLRGFKFESRFSTWLFRLSSNMCIDFLRKSGRRSEFSLDDRGEAGERANEIPDLRYCPETELEKKELAQSVSQALLRLSPEHRQIVVMRDLCGLSYGEIACALSLEEGTVKSRLFRARERMRQELISKGNFFSPPPSKPAKGGERA